MEKYINGVILSLALLCATAAAADNPIIINNNVPQQAPNTNNSGCNNNNQANNYQGPPQGTSYQTNPRGGTDTIYSTGNKQPYIVDNNCNNNPPIQPFVYAQPPGPPVPVPRR